LWPHLQQSAIEEEMMEVSTLEDENPMLSRNVEQKLSNKIASYSRRTETSDSFWLKYQ